MVENFIDLKSIRSLSGMHFFIPDYQRGYRWSATEAKLLLNDFKEFVSKEHNAGEFYCLQPIVVRKRVCNDDIEGEDSNAEHYEVIDGQQRLTTLYILMKCLETIRLAMYPKFEMYTIKYETRLAYDSQYFLENINNPDVNKKSDEFIDFYYMKKVYDTINEWFSKVDDQVRLDMLSALLGEKVDTDSGSDRANNIRVIWYEVADNDRTSSVDIFTRLNIGKIPLTNAELIKALLLRRGNFSDTEASMRQLQISSEWNLMEQKLQDDSFWYFLCRTSWPFKYFNRIEFIFDIMKGRTEDSEAHFTFNEFNDELKNLDDVRYPTIQSRVEFIWNEIKAVFQSLEEWYDDRNLYHYIGFLIEYGADIKKLQRESVAYKKDEFLSKCIKDKIKTLFKNVKISELSYGDKNIRMLLLMFNILTALQSKHSDMRFPFYKYKKGKWDIEHICSQTDRYISDDKQRKQWIDDMLEFFTGCEDHDKRDEYISNLRDNVNNKKAKNKVSDEYLRMERDLHFIDRISKLMPNDAKSSIDASAFDVVFSEVQKYFKEDKQVDKDSIGNLALLDAETNRAYGNAFFPIKRKWIISNDSRGIFVPIATKNVFLKYYSRKGNDLMFWGASDAEDYTEAVKDVMKDYVNE